MTLENIKTQVGNYGFLKKLGFQVLSAKDRITQPFPHGYRDINMALQDKQTGHVGELQVQVKAMQNVKGDGHSFYEIKQAMEDRARKENRSLTDDEKQVLNHLNTVSKGIYDGALIDSLKSPTSPDTNSKGQ